MLLLSQRASFRWGDMLESDFKFMSALITWMFSHWAPSVQAHQTFTKSGEAEVAPSRWWESTHPSCRVRDTAILRRNFIPEQLDLQQPKCQVWGHICLELSEGCSMKDSVKPVVRIDILTFNRSKLLSSWLHSASTDDAFIVIPDSKESNQGFSKFCTWQWVKSANSILIFQDIRGDLL